jgi:hypothetical protein
MRKGKSQVTGPDGEPFIVNYRIGRIMRAVWRRLGWTWVDVD